MEITEGILWVMMGFIPTLISVDVAWRLAKRQARARARLRAPGYFNHGYTQGMNDRLALTTQIIIKTMPINPTDACVCAKTGTDWCILELLLKLALVHMCCIRINFDY